MTAQQRKKLFHERYEIQTIVGRGSKSVVYRAQVANSVTVPPTRTAKGYLSGDATPNRGATSDRDNTLVEGMPVALKVILPPSAEDHADRARLRSEALALSSCQHRYVIRLYDVQVHELVCYLALEYAECGDLKRYAESSGGFIDREEGETLLMQALEALSFVHSVGIIHRDLKPENMLVVSPGQFRLGDFGVAALPGDCSTPEELARAVGTLDYMAPEVLRGTACDERSDLYSLALSFYETLTGCHPFAHTTLANKLTAREQPLRPINDVIASQGRPLLSPHIARLLSRALSPERNNRPESAQAMLHQMGRATTFFSALGPEVSDYNLLFAGEVELNQRSTERLKEVTRDITLEQRRGGSSSEWRAKNLTGQIAAMSDQSDDRPRDGKDKRGPGPFFADPDLLKATRARTEYMPPDQMRDLRKSFGNVPPLESQEQPAAQEKRPRKTPPPQEKPRVPPVSYQAPRKKRLLSKLIAGALVLGIIGVAYTSFVPKVLEDKPTVVTGEIPSITIAPGFSLPQYTGAPLTFPLMPAGVFQGTIKSLIPKRSIPLAFISLGGGVPLVVLIGLEGFQTPAIRVNPDETLLRIPANGYVLEFTAADAVSTDKLSGTVTNLTTGETGTWKVIPQRLQ